MPMRPTPSSTRAATTMSQGQQPMAEASTSAATVSTSAVTASTSAVIATTSADTGATHLCRSPRLRRARPEQLATYYNSLTKQQKWALGLDIFNTLVMCFIQYFYF